MKAEVYLAIRIMQTRRYSEHTIKAYIRQIEFFLEYFKNDPKYVSDKQIQEYFIRKVYIEKISPAYQNQAINAIKFLYQYVIERPIINEAFIRPKKSKSLPTVLSKEEVKAIINSIPNLKHKAIISTIYGCGLRVSEVINLHLIDIDSKRMIIHIRKSKGRKDRIVPLSENLLLLLRKYWIMYKTSDYLFEGSKKQRYSVSSINSILHSAIKKTKISKHVSIHTLRHSYATHLMEDGINIRYIQSILGHSNLKTTEIYTHVSKAKIAEIQSPIEDIL